jgi:hypothetical protein
MVQWWRQGPSTLHRPRANDNINSDAVGTL